MTLRNNLTCTFNMLNCKSLKRYNYMSNRYTVSPVGLYTVSSLYYLYTGQKKMTRHCTNRCVTYMSLVVHLVVGELDPVEADDLTHPRLACARRVRVHVEPRGDAGVVRVPSHHPLGAVVHVPARP